MTRHHEPWLLSEAYANALRGLRLTRSGVAFAVNREHCAHVGHTTAGTVGAKKGKVRLS
jgi:hypothetical protein